MIYNFEGLTMNTRIRQLFIICLLAISAFINACQKDKNAIDFFLSNGSWQLANLQEFTYIGSSLQKTDTLNKKCPISQVITFSSDRKTSYNGNFQCINQTGSGQWTLIQRDTIRLQSDLALKDSTGKQVQPFADSQVINLGQYSLVIETGDISPVYTQKQLRKILRYSFVH